MKKHWDFGRMTITDDEFNDLLKECRDFLIKQTQEAKRKSLMFYLHVYARHNFGGKFTQTLIAVADTPKVGDKTFNRYQMMQAIGMKYYEEQVKKKPSGEKCYPIAVVFESKVWVHIEKTKGDLDKIRNKDWGKLPEKQEAVALFGRTIDGRTNMATLKIHRDKKRRMTLEADMWQPFNEDQTIGSDLMDAFYHGFMMAMHMDVGLDKKQNEDWLEKLKKEKENAKAS